VKWQSASGKVQTLQRLKLENKSVTRNHASASAAFQVVNENRGSLSENRRKYQNVNLRSQTIK
jgi:hypothetical protein